MLLVKKKKKKKIQLCFAVYLLLCYVISLSSAKINGAAPVYFGVFKVRPIEKTDML